MYGRALGVELTFALGSPPTVHDTVDGARRLVERELGDVRANESRLDRDDRRLQPR
jgi:hypothetical protein